MNDETGQARSCHRRSGGSVVEPLAADPHAPQRGVIVDQMPAQLRSW